MMQSLRELTSDAATPHAANIDEHLVTLLRRSSPEAEQYNSLRFAIEARAADGLRTVAVTSPTAGDGKTTTAINLAGALAHRREGRVLLVDVDLRRPSIGELLDLDHLDRGDQRVGLVDALMDADLTLDRVTTQVPASKLWVLTAGRFSDEPFELLRTPRMKDLLQEARRQYEFVVVDTAPLLLVPDSRVLETLVDGFLLVVAAHRTPHKLVEEAVNLLNPSKLVGLVFNGDDRPLSRHYGGYYGYGYGNSPAGTSRRRARWP
jgi:capsular exopolysaccharide synthesis family protein